MRTPNLLHFGMEGAQGGDMLALDVTGVELSETWTPYGKYDLDQDLVGGITCVGFDSFEPRTIQYHRVVISTAFPLDSSLQKKNHQDTTEETVTEHKGELQELLNDALDTGCAVLTAQPCPNT